MPFATTAKNQMLDGLTVDRIRLHSGNPGSAGTDNELGAGLSAATFSAASGSERVLASDVTVTGLAANQSVTHYSVWLNSGTVFRGAFAISTGDTTANAAGEFILKSPGTKLQLLDPS
jgi:hypothetical protein